MAYNIRYSDYPTSAGPPDPIRWVGPPGPPGPQGEPGVDGTQGLTHVVVADAAPSGAPDSTLWWDSAGTGLYVRYNDGNSTQWVVAQNQNAGIAGGGHVTGKLQIGATGWLSPIIPGTEENSLLVSLSTWAGSGGVFGTRTSDGGATGAEGAWAIGGFAINDNTTAVQTAYGEYIEVRRNPNAGTTHGMEIATINHGDTKQNAPYYMGQMGSTLGLWLSAGRDDVSPDNNPSLAIGIDGSNARFDRGIMFGWNSVDVTGPQGAIAIGMPYQYALVWYLDDGGASHGAGAAAAVIRSDVTSTAGLLYPPSLIFGNGSLGFDPGTGTDAAIFAVGLNTLQQTQIDGDLSIQGGGGETIHLTSATGDITMHGTLSAARVSSPSVPVTVKDFGAKGDGTTNDAVAIQAAATAAAGGILLFPANATYLIGAPIYLSSDTTVMAHGAKIVPAPGIASLPGSSNPALGSSLGPVMFANVNWQATTITDQNIRWFGGTLGPLTTRLACHGLFLRMVRNTHIADARFQLLNDCVAHLACVNTLVTGCMSSDFMNCAYDHWDGPGNATVRDCEARGGQSGVSTNGVLFNTDSTVTGHSSGVAATATIDNVRVYGCDQGVNAGPLIAGPTCNDVTVTNCYISGGTYGVYFSGVTGGRITGNVVSGSLNPVLIGIVGDAAHPSSQIDITANRFENCAATQQYIQAAGPQMTVAHNRAVNCTSGGWALLIDDPSTVVMPNYLPGYNFAFLLNQHPYGGVTVPAMTVLADSTHNPGCTVSTGAAVPAATEPAGSIYMRTGGAAGARLYVSAGAGTWAAVAGV